MVNLNPFSTPKANQDPNALNPVDVVDFYLKLDKDQGPDQEIVKSIRMYPVWHFRRLTLEDLGRLDWHFNNDKNNISWFLTESGSKRSSLDVAKYYLSERFDCMRSTWDGSKIINQWVDIVVAEGKLPPIIIVEGDRYPSDSNSPIIDGFYRTMAYLVSSLINPQDSGVIIEAYVGKKSLVLDRLSDKLASVIR